MVEKTKRANLDESVKDENQVEVAKKRKLFSARHFRKEIHGEDSGKAVRHFNDLANNANFGEDVILEYLEAGGSVQELLSLLDVTAKEDLTAALPIFKAVNFILNRAQTMHTRHKEQSEQGLRYLFNSFIPTINAMLSLKNDNHRKVILKLLTSSVACNSAFGREILTLIPLTSALIEELTEVKPGRDTVRRSFIFFILSFLLEGNVGTIYSILTKKDIIGCIITGLKFDEAATVNVVLSMFKEKILENSKIKKTSKLEIFNTQIVKSLIELYDWKGPQNIKSAVPHKKPNFHKEFEVNPDDKELVTVSVHDFLLVLCTSKKYGLIFHDKTIGSSGKSSNQLILTALESLPMPWSKNETAELFTKILINSPDLMKTSLDRLESSLQPRKSAVWIRAFKFLEDLLSSVDAIAVLKEASTDLTINQMFNVSRSLCCPPVLMRCTSQGLKKSQPLLIQYYSLRMANLMWRLVQNVTKCLGFPHAYRKKLNYDFMNVLLKVNDVLELWHQLCQNKIDLELDESLAVPEKSDVLFVLLNSLRTMSEYQPDSIVSSYDLGKNLIDNVEMIEKSLPKEVAAQLKLEIFHFITTTDSSCLTPDTDLFAKAVTLLSKLPESSSLSPLTKIFLDTGLFENNEEEVDIWLCVFFSLPDEYKDEVSNILVQATRKGCEMTLNLNQAKSSEFIDHSNKEAILQELMGSDLADVKELEHSKISIPSLTPMIVYYLETVSSGLSKDEKSRKKSKALKHYLNNVIAHLSHFYSKKSILLSICCNYKEMLSDSLWSYLEDCSKNELNYNFFASNSEKDLATWLGNSKDLNIPSSIKEETNKLKLFLLYKMTLFYLSDMTIKKILTESDVKKFTDLLLFMIKELSSAQTVTKDNLILSSCASSENIFFRKCIYSFFMEETLLQTFNPFECKINYIRNCTDIIFGFLRNLNQWKKDEKYNNDISYNENIVRPWKLRFLKLLGGKLEKQKALKNIDTSAALNFFRYSPSEVSDVLNKFCLADLNIFGNKKELSTWSYIFIKFLKIQCNQGSTCRLYLERLCKVMEHLSNNKSLDLKVFDECLLFILQQRPHFIKDVSTDFMTSYIHRFNLNDSTVKCGKLLLSHPEKVIFFVKYLGDNLDYLAEWKIVLPLLSFLVVKKKSFLFLMKQRKHCLLWMEEDLKNDDSEFLNLLGATYKSYKSDILYSLSKEKLEHISENGDFICLLINLFMDKRDAHNVFTKMPNPLILPKIMLAVLKKVKDKTCGFKFMKSLLTTFCKLLNNPIGNLEEVWTDYCNLVKQFFEFFSNTSWKEITETTKWKSFSELALRSCVSRTGVPNLVEIFRSMLENFYEDNGNSVDIKNIFQMLTTHSEFFNVILKPSPLKYEIMNLIMCLVTKNTSVISGKHVPVFLASYSASLSACDQLILKLLLKYEELGVDINAYEPFVWGATAINHYSIKSNSGLSLWRQMNMLNVLNLFDLRKVKKTIAEFPIQKTNQGHLHGDLETDTYDPAFFLPLFSNLLSPGAVTYCQQFIYKGGLALTICSLSSKSNKIRSLAATVLSRFYSHLELIQNSNQRSIWLHIIDSLRFSVADLLHMPLPSIIAIFLARATLGLTEPLSEMFGPLKNYILAKHVFNLRKFPEFMVLFHSSEVQFEKHREWILEVMKDGAKEEIDLNIIMQSNTLKHVLSIYNSRLCTLELKVLILKVLSNIIKIKTSYLLISQNGLLTWISHACDKIDNILLEYLVNLAAEVMYSYKSYHQDCMAQNELNSIHLSQLVNIALKILPHFKRLNKPEYFKIFLTSFHSFLLFSLEMLESNQFFLCEKNMNDLIESGMNVLGKGNNFSELAQIQFYFCNLGKPNDMENKLREVVFLFNLLLK